MTDPNAPSYLDRLQAADREQGLLKLRTLLAQHRQNLARLPKLAAELQGLLAATDVVDHDALAANMENALAQANDFLLALDMVPIDYPEQPELISLGDKLCPLVNSTTVAALSARFAQARDGAKQAAKAAQAEQARQAAAQQAEQAKDDAERAKQLAAQQAVLDRRAAASALGFVDHGDGTVTDSHHGLMWMQCAQGQSGADCKGNPGAFAWDVAMQIPQTLNLRGGFAGHKDWRLPTKEELVSLVMHGRTSPAICTEAFPNAPSTWFWSSSPNVEGYAWYVGFGNGVVSGGGRDSDYAVRLVRASQ